MFKKLFNFVDNVAIGVEILKDFSKDIVSDEGEVQSRSLYLKDNQMFIQENLTLYSLSKVIPKEQFELITDLKIRSGKIYVIHALLGLVVINPYSLEFKKEYTVFDYTMTIESHVEQRNKKVLLGFCAVLVGGVCLALTSGIFGVGILAAGATYMMKAQLSHAEYIGINKKYYMPSLLNILSDQAHSEISFIQSFFDNPLKLLCEEKYLVVNLSGISTQELIFLKQKISEFLNYSFSENRNFLSIGEKLGYHVKSKNTQ